MVEIGKQLKYYRQRNQMTQKDVAKLLHVTPQTLSKWELNKSTPDYDQLILLSKIYKKNVDVLLGQAKPSFIDYLANTKNFINQYGIYSLSGGDNNGENSKIE